MKTGGINREILRLALPSILANITVPLVGMVDIAVAGHLGGAGAGAAALIGGIAIGTMLFDLLYWNFGFLRVSTGGMTAQAFGRWKVAREEALAAGDSDEAGVAGGVAAAAGRECVNTLTRSIGIALASALVLILIQWIFVKAAFLVVKCSPEVRTLASQYFFIRIWAAPATLSLMAFKGWFIGMQNSIAAMTTDLVVNGVNILGSIILALGLPGIGFAGMGFAGVAWGTVVAQYSGLLCALIFLLARYSGLFAGLGKADLKAAYSGSQNRKFFSMNGDVFVRSLCFIAIYIGYTIISARYGDELLASCSIMMKLLMIFSYFTDGFAYAGEALCGRFIGARDDLMFSRTVRWSFVWSAGLAVAFMFVYGFGGIWLLKMMTSDQGVVQVASEFIPWLLAMPVAGVAAFMWDGIFIGATASKAVRNAMLWAVAAFTAVWFGGQGLSLLAGSLAGGAAVGLAWLRPLSAAGSVHLLMGAYFAHLLARTVYLTVKYFQTRQ